MKSKPEYHLLALNPEATYHLFIASDGGVNAVVRALRGGGEAPFAAKILYVATDNVVELPNVSASAYSSQSDLQACLRSELASVGMGAAYYVAGSEPFIWAITTRLVYAGVPLTRIQQEIAGDTGRTVYCVHCGVMNYNVVTSAHPCTGCGSVLEVRDHFSRPLGAYMGVVLEAAN